MNCYNQQFTGMPGMNAPERPMMPSWQNQPKPAEMEMFGWQRPMMSDMDCNMPPTAILPAANPRTANPMAANPMAAKSMNFSEKMDCGRFPLAMSYVPMQKWSQPSPLCEGFTRGTMFRELDLPFVMGRCI